MNFREQLKNFRDQKIPVLVVGLGISGLEAALSLARMGISVRCTEGKSEKEFLASTKYPDQYKALKELEVEIHFAVTHEQLPDLLIGVELCVLSPGVSLQSPFALALKDAGVRITNELELAVELLQVPAVFVTGTNGKSTVVTLIAALLEREGYSVLLCGNVGRPVIAGLDTALLNSDLGSSELDYLVVEISSYQIESSHCLVPHVGVFLNLSENHLERHKTMERYFDIKASLFQNQRSEDYFLFNADDSRVCQLKQSTSAHALSFSKADPGDNALSGAAISYSPSLGCDEITVSYMGERETYLLNECPLIGLHNRYNISAAILAARVLGVSPATVRFVINSFQPLEHRIEKVPTASDRVVFNDSKATTPLATCAALVAVLEQYPTKPLCLCIGGKLKRGGDIAVEWEEVLAILRNADQQIELICFGEDGRILQDLCDSAGIEVSYAPSVDELVHSVSRGQWEVLLFSPGCASFDEFSDFESRGRHFKSAVQSSFEIE